MESATAAAHAHAHEEHHGPPQARRYAYDPTYMFRGLKALHLEFTPVA